jgi:uncharacterized membrane protein
LNVQTRSKRRAGYGGAVSRPRRLVTSRARAITHHAAANPRCVAGASWALSLLLLTTGTWHLAAPAGFESIVPGFLGSPAVWVAISGVAELACAVGLAFRPTRRIAGWACVALFVVVYPANIKMALDSLDGHGSALTAWLRLPLQIPLLLWALYIARRAHLPSVEPETGSSDRVAPPLI